MINTHSIKRTKKTGNRECPQLKDGFVHMTMWRKSMIKGEYSRFRIPVGAE